jgi:hypothetical protein
MEVAGRRLHGAISIQKEVRLQCLWFILQDAIEQTGSAIRVEELFLIRFNVIPTEVVGKGQEEGFDGEGGDELIEIPSSVRFRVCEPREIERGSVT